MLNLMVAVLVERREGSLDKDTHGCSLVWLVAKKKLSAVLAALSEMGLVEP